MSGRSSLIFAVVLAVSLVGLWGCGSDETSTNRNVLVKGNNQFAFDLYGQLREEGPQKNTFFSPVSISIAMSMVQAGARGSTADEIAQAMHFTLPQSELHPACRSLLKISQAQDICELDVTNQLWAHQDYKFLDSFLNITNNQYGAKCGLVDFVSDRDGAMRKINSRIENQTRGRIGNQIKPYMLDGTTRLVLVNTIYFKAQWSEPFLEQDTSSAPFYSEEGESHVKLMSMLDHSCKYAEIDGMDMQVLEKPYDESFDLSMMILLPKREPGSLARLEAILTEEKLAVYSKQLRSCEVKIALPKFRLESNYSLEKPLSHLGIRSAFDRGADLSGMDGSHNLFLQFAIHKTFISVDEQGTEAAAATVIGVGMGGPPPKPVSAEFRADHPFIFLIRDNRTGSILFLGRFCGP